jgi:hypothetical protein
MRCYWARLGCQAWRADTRWPVPIEHPAGRPHIQLKRGSIGVGRVVGRDVDSCDGEPLSEDLPSSQVISRSRGPILRMKPQVNTGARYWD